MNERRNLPVVIAPPPRRQCRCTRAAIILAFAGLGIGLIGAATFSKPAPRLVWNASASAPVGLYWLSKSQPSRGDLVLAEPPKVVRRFAAERGYLPVGVPLVKRVAALAGDAVCAVDRLVVVNGQAVAERLASDSLGRPLPRWTGCHVLTEDELFLLMEGEASSFDGRYFGPVDRASVIGTLTPLWTD